ncbi:MAG: M23 family metallopeptidase, partial [Syntrophales bacterium]|nr:M23 family metallopeptidase [Syntrophales bacterium]
RPGRSVEQGQTIGNVGATGLATGPHLHYEVRIGNKSLNPLALKIPKGWPVPHKQLAAFCSVRDRMDGYLSAMGTCEVPSRPERTILKTTYDASEKGRAVRIRPSRDANSL